MFSRCTCTSMSRKYLISSFTCFYCFIYFYFSTTPIFFPKKQGIKRCSLKLNLWQVALIDQEYMEEKGWSPAMEINSLLFVAPAKESTFEATHHANEIWQVWSGLESLSQRRFVKPVPSLPTVSHICGIPFSLPIFRFVGSHSAVTSTEGIRAAIACTT